MNPNPTDFRQAIADYIRIQAQPRDKFRHQPRLYHLARSLGEGRHYDDDVLYAAAWMHDLGVFTGHRPENPALLDSWDNVAYAVREAPSRLRQLGFPPEKIPSVVEAVRTHLPSGQPTSVEGELLRDADLLEQLGAIGILRMISKVGRDTRYPTHADALRVLRHNAEALPSQLRLPLARQLAGKRLSLMEAFFKAVEEECGEVDP